MQTFTFANQKGGVGKSTLAVHKAISHADDGARVLFIDFDNQCNSTASLRTRGKIALDAIQLFSKDDLPNIESEPGITLFQGTPNLIDVARLPNDIVTQPRKHLAKIANRFDYCIIDTPPTLGIALISALVMANFVISPMMLSAYSIQGIQQLLNTIKGVQNNKQLNPELVFLGMIPNMVNSRASLHKDGLKEIYQHFGEHIIKHPIINRIAVQEAVDSGQAVWELKSGAAREAAKEMRTALKIIQDLATARAAA